VRRRRQDHDVDVAVDHFFVGVEAEEAVLRIDAHAILLVAELVLEPRETRFHPVLEHVARGRQEHLPVLREQRVLRRARPAPAAADDADADRVLRQRSRRRRNDRGRRRRGRRHRCRLAAEHERRGDRGRRAQELAPIDACGTSTVRTLRSALRHRGSFRLAGWWSAECNPRALFEP
jgi:hypothetical protein